MLLKFSTCCLYITVGCGSLFGDVVHVKTLLQVHKYYLLRLSLPYQLGILVGIRLLIFNSETRVLQLHVYFQSGEFRQANKGRDYWW